MIRRFLINFLPKRNFAKRILVIIWACFFTACTYNETPVDDPEVYEYQRFSDIFIDVFDTVTIVLGYAKSQEEFQHLSRNIIRTELNHLHQLFDIFNEYPEINNLRTINNNAGLLPVEVDPVIIDLLKLSIEGYHNTGGVVNIALGPVTSIWREAMVSGGEQAVPPMEKLLAAGELTDINNVIIDEENNTVFLRYEGMSLDVGGIAKGFAIELATQKALDAGFESFTLNVGGDVRVAYGPLGGIRDSWGIGIENPLEAGEMIDAVFVTHNSVFSSGDYLRYFIVDDVRYHHLIDPRTLKPATRHRSAAVIYPHAGIADILSTAAFILDANEAKALLANFGAEAIWVLPDGDIILTEGFEQYRS